MHTFTKALAGLNAALLLTVISSTAQAGANEALASCKNQIAQDDRLSAYSSVSARLDHMRRRGRYSNYRIDVKARDADGQITEWVAQCKARDSGRVESLELAQTSRADGLEVAQRQ